jgi:hypothetical protein
LEEQALQNDKSWYQRSAEDVFDALESGIVGLSTAESKARLEKYGYNERKFKKVGLVSVVMALARFMMFYYYGEPAISGSVVDPDKLLMQARTAAFTTVMLVHICYIFTARSITESAFKFSPFSNKWVLIGVAITLGLQLTIIYVLPSMGVNPFSLAPDVLHNRVREVPDKTIWKREGLKQCCLPACEYPDNVSIKSRGL